MGSRALMYGVAAWLVCYAQREQPLLVLCTINHQSPVCSPQIT